MSAVTSPAKPAAMMNRPCNCSLRDGRPHPHPMQLFDVRLCRDTRFDICKGENHEETVRVESRSREHVADAVLSQHRQWSNGNFHVLSVTVVGLAPCPSTGGPPCCVHP